MFDQPRSEHFEKKLQRDLALLNAVQANLPQLETLLVPFQAMYEQGIYRFYHHSFKVYQLQQYTSEAVETFRHIGDERTTKSASGLNKSSRSELGQYGNLSIITIG